MKRFFCILLCGILVLSMTACGKPSEEDIGQKLYEIDCWLAMDVWENGFRQIVLYSAGEKEEEELGDILQGLSDSLEKKEEYEKYIGALEDARYDTLKERWGYVSGEIDKLYASIQEDPPRCDGSYTLDTMMYEYYSNTFWDELSKLGIYQYVG